MGTPARAANALPRLFIGISGWTYAGWRGRFYPDELPHKRELHFASRLLNCIEINGTFYSLQRPSSFERWHEQTPDGFCFAVKGSRFITHMKQLRDVTTPLANFFASGVLRLEDKLGPLLWQFSDRMRFDPDRFSTFLKLLPRSTRAASRLARGHDTRMTGRSSYHTDVNRRIRHAIEVRHASFMNDEFLDLLREHDTALVFSDAAADWPYAEDVTSDFIYARLHGADELYASGYGDQALNRWAARLATWRNGGEPADAQRAGSTPSRAARGNQASGMAAPGAGGRDVFVFFDNDAKVHAPFDALELAWKMNVDWRFQHDE